MRYPKTTHTYAVLQISRAAYDEIRGKLLEADYGHALQREEGFELIDMHGIALQALEVPAAGEADRLKLLPPAPSPLRRRWVLTPISAPSHLSGAN